MKNKEITEEYLCIKEYRSIGGIVTRPDFLYHCCLVKENNLYMRCYFMHPVYGPLYGFVVENEIFDDIFILTKDIRRDQKLKELLK